MKRNISKCLVFLLSMALGVNGFSGNLLNDDWHLHRSEKGIDIYISQGDCNRPERGTSIQYVYIRLVNKNNHPVNISFDKELWYDGKCASCENAGNEFKAEYILMPEENISGGCGQDNGLNIFARMLNVNNVRKLTHYELKNIQIERLD